MIARVAPPRTLPELGRALEAGDADVIAALEDLDAAGAADLASATDRFSPLARAALARALATAPAGSSQLAVLLHDADPDVAYAALRSALAFARGGGALPAADVTAARDGALAALHAHLAARDALAALVIPSRGPVDEARWSACARTELELATRRAGSRDGDSLFLSARYLVRVLVFLFRHPHGIQETHHSLFSFPGGDIFNHEKGVLDIFKNREYRD